MEKWNGKRSYSVAEQVRNMLKEVDSYVFWKSTSTYFKNKPKSLKNKWKSMNVLKKRFIKYIVEF